MKTIAGRPGYEREVMMLFPTAVRLALPIMEPALQLAFWVVPVDDTRCRSFHAWFLPLDERLTDGERGAKVARVERFLYEMGDTAPPYHSTKINYQDKFAVTSQGPLVDRSLEHLGYSDKGVALLRKLFLKAIDDVEAGRDPRGLRRKAPEIVHFANVN
jgi:hypothetical protein